MAVEREEPFQARIGQRMTDELVDDLEGNRAHVSAGQGRLEHVQRVARRGHKNLRVEIVIVEDGLDVVYVAFFLTESNRVLVYTPDRQPASPEEGRKIIGDGLNFIETVGFMMDRIELDSKEESAKMLEKIPVFRRVSC